ncbi:MAG: integrase arm-type DNA-binding domain-containing protein [Bacteroidetes bacterium]|nr:integrase arm-type DNA-binding domain-containing protein [Bacteroidota bacterium]
MSRLNTSKVQSAKAGKHHDGDGLYLVVDPKGNRSWLLRATLNGKRRAWGLGAAKNIGLADVREKAAEYRKQIRTGINPAEINKINVAAVQTFAETAEQAHKAKRDGWKNPKHAQQWINSLRTYAFPKIGNLPVDEIDTPEMLKVLQPIWLTKEETARRVRQRLGAVIDFAVVNKWRTHRVHMDLLDDALPKQKKRDSHHAALPYADLPQFMATINETVAASSTILNALKFTILTAARSGEARLADWSEIDLEAATWTVPADRMKMGREHRVPLSDAALSVLGKRGEGLIFKGRKEGRALSDMSLLMPLKRAGLAITVHGFRSTFRDWSSEETGFSHEVQEMALAHTIGNKVEAAYRRGDLFEKRRALMDAWAAYCYPRENVVSISKIIGAG